jgi:hypothetical protein
MVFTIDNYCKICYYYILEFNALSKTAKLAKGEKHERAD